LGHGNLTKLGPNAPQNGGTHMLGLSSGTARDPTDPGYKNVSGFDKGYTTSAAPGYPAPAPACPGVVTGQPHDGAAVRLTIRVPTNAKSFTFNSNFFSFEFPNYICSTYNDTFVVEMAPAPAGASTGGNIAFDQSGNPISVNNALLQACTAQTAGGKQFTCPLGPSSLTGTGFAGHAATGWLQTQVNVDASLKGKDITIVFAVWDSGDGILDSTALVDNFEWSIQPGQNTPVTQPNPAQ
ncbi:MAG TPA: choice-of-anchor L domain-containing protein, partial [Polyangiaceae bacterium]